MSSSSQVSSAHADASASAAERTRRGERLGLIIRSQGLVFMALLIGVYFTLNSPFFFTATNALTIGGTGAALGVMAVAQTYLIVSGGVDVSVGSVVALSTITTALLLEQGIPVAVVMVLVVAAGAAVGLVNALLVVRAGVNPLIATLGTLSVFQGLAFALTGGQTRVVNNPVMSFIGIRDVLGLPVPLIVFLIIFVIAAVAERFTTWGKTVYTIGGNAEAARLAGLRVKSTQTLLYVLSGASAGLAGILLTSQLSAASPQVGATFLLSVITACVLGGASLAGGRGSVFGTLVAVVILGMLSNGFALLGWSSSAQQIALGMALIFAVLLDQTTRRLRGM